MKYKVTRWEIDNLLEETGDDYSMIHVFLSFNDEPELRIPVILNFDQLQSHIKNTASEEYNYIQKIRSNIGGYGPKHSKMISVMEAEGYDFSRHILTYITEKIAEGNYEYNHRIQANPIGFAKKSEEMKELHEGLSLKETNIRHTAFLETIDKTLHEITLKFFPELFDMSDTVLEKYKHQLITTTIQFAESIDKLTFKKKM